MQINSFQDIISQHQLSRETLEGIEKKLGEMAGGQENVTFTSLQRQAFNTPGFWREDGEDAARHIIVQGATSSGKTLVSEIAIMDCLKSRKKAIVLVPLKAMVRERWEHFKEDLEPQGTRQVYASSGDFQDHDGDIVNGDYEVAVIVYEKFFAMLFQNNSSIMRDCALLVVDELQMLSSSHRGPKLEIAIQKVLQDNQDSRRNAAYIRIMCLTTCDCRVSYIQKWLTMEEAGYKREPILIENKARPVSLKEHIIMMDGTWRMKYVRGEQEKGEQEKDEEEGKIEVPGYDADHKPRKAKELLLKALLKEIYEENPHAKVLIFANGRNRTNKLASFLADQNVLTYEKLSGKLKDIRQYEGDEYQKLLENQLFPHHISFHNAALSVALREYIEDIYQTEKKLCLVVATETLTIGMNMPVDVMILFDTLVHRGHNKTEALTSQEYKNFVGRAGRLGQNRGAGKSYTFAVTKTDYNKYWEKYVNCRFGEIQSALSESGEKVLAPYFLGLLRDCFYKQEEVNKIWEESFAHKCRHKQIDIKSMIDMLQTAQLSRLANDENDDDQYGDEEEEQYSLTDFGRAMAPYAFQLSSCSKIKRFFFNGGYRKVKDKNGRMDWQKRLDPGKGGLPGDVTREEIEKGKYLLDMLYILCRTEEVSQLSQLKLPLADKNPDKSREALDKVEAELKKMITPGEGKEALCQVWPESALQNMLENGYVDERKEKEAVMRAILLWHWTQGKRIEEIIKSTGFGSITSIVSGDVARLAEVVSYQMEAIHHCYGGYSEYTKFKTKALEPLYALSTSVNYGMPRNLVIIANRHLRGLDRKTILKIGKRVQELGKYDSPVNYLKEASAEELEGVIDDSMRKQLLRSIDELYLRDNLEMLLENIKKFHQGEWQLTSDEESAIMELSRIKSDAENDVLLTSLNMIFPDEDFFAREASVQNDRFYHKPSIKLQLLAENAIAKLEIGGQKFSIGVYHGDAKIAEKFQNYIQSNQHRNILLVRNEGILEDIKYSEENGAWNLLDEQGAMLISGIHLAMTNKIFAGLIAQDMALNDTDGSAFAAMLLDTQGVFRSAGMQALLPFLQNYEVSSEQHPNHEQSSQAVLRVLCDKREGVNNGACGKLFDELERKGISFRVLQWGQNLQAERPADAPTLLYLSWEAVKGSASLYHFHQALKQNQYKNTFAIFESEEEFRQWGTNDSRLPCNELDYCIKDENFKEAVEKAALLVSNFQKPGYLIGVSYAHQPDAAGERLAVTQLRKIVSKLNEAFLESIILFDGNPSCEGKFDGNGAKTETLALYQQCSYFIVLDDQYYDNSANCRQEGKTIAERCKDLPKKHLWLLHPNNDKHCFLFDEEEDYSTSLDYSEENTETVTAQLIKSIREDLEEASDWRRDKREISAAARSDT